MQHGAHRPGRALEDRERDRGRHLRELLEDQQRLQMAEPQATVLLRHVDTEKAHLGIAPAHRERYWLVFHFQLARQLAQLAAREAPRRVAQRLLFIGQSKIHRRDPCYSPIV